MDIKIAGPAANTVREVAAEVAPPVATPAGAPQEAAPAATPTAATGGKTAEAQLGAAAARSALAALPASVPSPYKHTDGPPGAYYRKVESIRSEDARGIEGTVVLPEPQFDSDPARWRMEVDKQPWKEGPCDRPSVYLGGNSGDREVDAGLTWDRVYNEQGDPTFTTDPNGWTREQSNVFTRDHDGKYLNAGTGAEATAEQVSAMKPNCAFRPYVRTSNVQTSEVDHLNKEQQDTEKAKDWHSPRRYAAETDRPENVYFYPGDRVTMKFGVRPTTKGDNRNVGLSIGTEDGTNRSYSGAYRQENWPGADFSFKRVTSVDQVGAEKSKKQVQATESKLNGCEWESVGIRDTANKLTPLTSDKAREVRGADTSKNYTRVFQFRPGSFDDHGSETVDINPAKNR